MPSYEEMMAAAEQARRAADEAAKRAAQEAAEKAARKAAEESVRQQQQAAEAARRSQNKETTTATTTAGNAPVRTPEQAEQAAKESAAAQQQVIESARRSARRVKVKEVAPPSGLYPVMENGKIIDLTTPSIVRDGPIDRTRQTVARTTERRQQQKIIEQIKRDDPEGYEVFLEAKRKNNNSFAQGVKAYNKRVEEIKESREKFIDEHIKTDSYLNSVLKSKGEDAAIAAFEKRITDIQGIYDRNYTKLPDGQYMKNSDIADIKKETPLLYQALMEKGYAETLGDLNSLKKNGLNKTYFEKLKEYGMVPERSILLGVDSNGEVRYMQYAPDSSDKEVQAAMQTASAELTTKLHEIEKANPGASSEQIGKLLENTREYRYYNEVADEYSKRPSQAERALKEGSIMFAEAFIPGVYAARHWEEMANWEKAITVAIDAISVLAPAFMAVKAAGAAARGVNIASRTARFLEAAKAVGGVAKAELLAPVNLILHPVESAKATIRDVRNLVEFLTSKGRVTESVITNSSGQIILRASDLGDLKTAAKASDRLMAEVANGESLYINIGKYKVELNPGALMKETGGFAHATTDLTDFEQGLIVRLKEGMPVKEQGLFLASDVTTDYIPQSATGKGAIPINTLANGQAERVWYYKPLDIARMDADPIRELTFTHAKNMPDEIAAEIETIVRKYKGRIGGSLNTYIKTPKAKRPNDVDAIFASISDAKAAQNEIMEAAKKAGYEVRTSPHKRDVMIRKRNGEWQSIIDLDTAVNHDAKIPAEYLQPARNINGFQVETLGEQYIRQSYGSVAGGAKVKQRTKSIEKMAKILEDSLKADGATVRRPGAAIYSGKEAEDAVSTGKLFYDVKEVESKYEVGKKTKPLTQSLWFRTGPRGIRAEVMLQKPLTTTQVLKLKAASLIDDLKAPFKPAITISKDGKPIEEIAEGLTNDEVEELARILRRGGSITRTQSLNMVSAARILSSAGVSRPTLDRFIIKRPPRRLPTRESVTIRDSQYVRGISDRFDTARLRVSSTVIRDAKGRIIPVKQSSIRPEKVTTTTTKRPATPEMDTQRITIPDSRNRIDTDVEPIRTKITTPDKSRIVPRKDVDYPPPPPRRGRDTFEFDDDTPPPIHPPKKRKDDDDGKRNRSFTEQSDWSRKDIESAIAWRDGVVVHAIRSPYRRGIDEATFSVKKLPDGLKVLKQYTGKGSQARSITFINKSGKIETGKLPKRLTVDVGNQDVIITKKKRGISIRHVSDRGTRTTSKLTIARTRNLSKKKGRVYHTRAAGGTIISRRGIRGR